MRHSAIYRAVLVLLLFVTATAPVVAGAGAGAGAGGQFQTGMADHSEHTSQMAGMDCCGALTPLVSGHSEQSRICDHMTSADCTLAASLGNCGQAVPALTPEKIHMRAQLSSGTHLLGYRNTYLSIILDTLTPPPNASKA